MTCRIRYGRAVPASACAFAMPAASTPMTSSASAAASLVVFTVMVSPIATSSWRWKDTVRQRTHRPGGRRRGRRATGVSWLADVVGVREADGREVPQRAAVALPCAAQGRVAGVILAGAMLALMLEDSRIVLAPSDVDGAGVGGEIDFGAPQRQAQRESGGDGGEIFEALLLHVDEGHLALGHLEGRPVGGRLGVGHRRAGRQRGQKEYGEADSTAKTHGTTSQAKEQKRAHCARS